MLLIRLKLENFRQHQDTLIDFRDGMTAIVGANGSGKSTLLEAITFALYGTQRDVREHIRFYWGDKKKYLVQVEFELDGRRYSVERTSSDAKLVDSSEGGKVLATGLGDVKRACERLLGLTYDQFVNSFCAEQKNLGFLNFRNAAARQDEVARMLGFDRLKRAEDISKERRAVVKSQAETLERTLADPAELRKAHDDARAQLGRVVKEIHAMEAEIEDLKVKLAPSLELRKVAEQWQSISVQIDRIGSNAETLKDAVKLAEKHLEATRKDIQELQGLEAKEAEYRRIGAEAKEWERRKEQDRERESLADQVKTMRCDLVDLEERLSQLPAVDLAAVEKTLMGATQNVDRLETQVREKESAWISGRTRAQEGLATAQALHASANSSLEHRREMTRKGKCPECGQPLGKGYEAVLRGAEEEMERLTKELAAAKEAATCFASKPAELERLDQEIALAKGELEKARLARERGLAADAQASTLRSERTKKREQMAKAEAMLANAPAVYDAAKHEACRASLAALEPLHNRYVVLEGCAKSLSEREEDHRVAKYNYDGAKAQYSELKERRARLPIRDAAAAEAAIQSHQEMEVRLRDRESCLKGSTEMRRLAEQAVVAADARLAEQKRRLTELEDAKSATVLFDVVAKEMRFLRESLNKGIGPDLVARASENLNLLTNGRYTALELDKDFQATVVEDGVPKAVISGGEEDVVALSLRLALSELIQERNGRPMSLLVLDEVFGALDAERRQSVMDRLASLKGRFRQILLISHIEEINQVADQALYLRRNPDTRAAEVSDVPPDLDYALD